MTMETKSRTLPFGGGISTKRELRRRSSTQQWETISSSSVARPTYMGSQITSSEKHDWPPSRGSRSDVGGPFSTTRYKGSIPYMPWRVDIDWPFVQGQYDRRRVIERSRCTCPIETVNGKPKWPTLQASSDSSLNAMGATAVSRCRPTASAAELSTALGELYRDRIPAAPGVNTWRERTLAARNAGDEYLNIEFGWKPLVSDVTKFRDAVANSRDILQQYDADRGNLIRRSYSFPDETSHETQVLSTNKSPDFYNGAGGSVIPGYAIKGGKWSKTTTTVKRRWFSGAFVYGVPQGSTPFEKARALGAEADRLYGISFTPDVFWNLTPWSWAIDWFTNTGDVLSTVGDYISQGLVMQYGYLMEHTITKVVYSLSGAVVYNRTVEPPDAVLRVESKKRVRANPFGFGLTWDGLSSSQQAILAALGLSRT